MDLLVVRHAVAEERDVFAETGEDDSRRPLTPAGRRKFKRGARGLRRLVPSVDLLATSALTRALETADILQKVYGIDSAVRLKELEPDSSPSALVRWLRRQRRRRLVGVVGHEPHLSRLVEYLLTGETHGFVDLKKGGACLLALGDVPSAGHAELRWLLSASQLRKFGA
jgi:phosphohistidine phosphatase